MVPINLLLHKEVEPITVDVRKLVEMIFLFIKVMVVEIQPNVLRRLLIED